MDQPENAENKTVMTPALSIDTVSSNWAREAAPESEFVAIDFEAYYDKDYTLSDMGPWEYVYDERFDPYMISIYGGPDFWYVGHPSKIPEAMLAAMVGKTLVMHNAAFDTIVLRRCVELGIMPDLHEWAVVDSADLVSYMQYPRALKDAAASVLGVSMDKTVRQNMKGKKFVDLSSEELLDLLNYSLGDAVNTYNIWMKLHQDWPAHERRISELNREAQSFGFNVDQKKLRGCLSDIEAAMTEAEGNIPWEWDEGKTPLSPHAMRKYCRESGIAEIPSSFSAKDLQYVAWEKKYSADNPWVQALKTWRTLNPTYQKLLTLKRGTRSDGTFSYSCKYFGARTGRFSGSGEARFNTQNLPRKPVEFTVAGRECAVDVRSLIVPRPGKVFIIADYAQIEARLLHWVVGDRGMLDAIREHGNLYEAYARKTGAWTEPAPLKKANPDKYQHQKVIVLSSGYGCGPAKYRLVAESMYGVVLSEEQAVLDIKQYRQNNPLIPQLWRKLDNAIRFAAREKQDFHLRLPSGRVIKYFSPRFDMDGNVSASSVDGEGGRNSGPRKLYGGLLTENYIQAIARDVICDGWIKLDNAGYNIIFTVHDEFLIEVEADLADEAAVRGILLEPPSWAKTLPLDVELKIATEYEK